MITRNDRYPSRMENDEKRRRMQPYFQTLRTLSIGFYVNIIIGAIFLISTVLVVFIINQKMRQQALLEAETKATLILNRNLATHTYFSHNLKPSLFEFTEPYRSKEYFDPTWMSSTYAIREIGNYFKSLATDEYYYKECAVNARSPENEADEYERHFIEAINNNKQVVKQSAIRVLDGKKYFVLLYRGEVMERSCLRCHDTPERAPEDLVGRYGAERSFFRSEGEVVSAVSIRIPVDIPYARANRITWELSGGMLIILSVLFVCQYFVHRQVVTLPLNRIQQKAIQISNSQDRIGEKLPPGFGKELRGIFSAFNTMSKKLRLHMDTMENTIQIRTSELSKSNTALKQEIALRELSETEKERLIRKLETALQEIKTLKGILPLCSYCKKIRNDDNSWEEVDRYIHKHSEADISHSLCPECIKTNYPEEMEE